jgi:hypothetical protein
MIDLSFICDHALGLFASLSPRTVKWLDHLVVILLQAFSQENRGVEPCHVFLVRRIMVLDELLMGQLEWGPGSHSRGSGMGQLVTDSRFLAASP